MNARNNEIKLGYSASFLIFVDLFFGGILTFLAWAGDGRRSIPFDEAGFQTWELVAIPVALLLLTLFASRQIIITENGLTEKYVGIAIREISWQRVSAVDLIGNKGGRRFVFSLDGGCGLDRSLWGFID